MRIAVVLPRNMHFGPNGATSIDLCARDGVLHSRHGSAMTVICADAPGLFDDVSLRRFHGRTTFGRVRAIAAIVREIGADLIIVHQHGPSAAGLARRLAPLPVALYMHNMPKPLRGPARVWREGDYRPLAGFIFVSHAARKAFDNLYPSLAAPRFVVPNGIDPAGWDIAGTRRREILAVGRIDPHKGSIAIAEALRRILPVHPHWQARFIGPLAPNTRFRRAFKRATADVPRLRVEGARPFEAVRDAALGAEIAVVASSREGFGRVAVEAFAAGNALVSTRFGGLAEVIDDCALSLERGDAAEIARALDLLIRDADLRADLARRGHARFLGHFTIETFARALDDTIATLRRQVPFGARPQESPQR